MKFFKRAAALLCAAVMLVSFSACGSKTDEDSGIPESTEGKDLVRAAEADHVFSLNCNMEYSFNPLIATNHSNELVCGLVYEDMVDLDNNFEVIPNIITEWSYTDDGKSWTFTLDTTHTFHDGTQVTGKDLRYSLERAIYGDRYSGRFSSVQGVSYSDDTLYVTLGIGDTDLIKLMNIPVIQAGSYDDDYPMGSGPYMYNEDYTALVPYDGYFENRGTEPPIDTVYLTQYSDAETIISSFEDGLIDLVINDPSSYTNLGYASSNEIHDYATTNMHYVMFNTETGYCSDSTFRYAMNYAFDRDYLVTLLNGNAVASAVPMYPTCANYPTELNNSLSYNLDTCRIVLENAGVRDYDEDGEREYMSAANPVTLTFAVCSDSSAKTGVVNRFADDMATLGIKVNVEELTWTEYKTALIEGTFDMYYGEIKLRNNFDLTPLLEVREDDYDDDRYIEGVDGAEDTINVTNLESQGNLNFSRCKDTACMDYMTNYLSAGSLEKKSAAQSLYNYLTSNGYLITIGFEEQQIISHRGAIKGVDANIGNPVWNFADWTISIG